MSVVPYRESSESKKKQVAEMFNNISHKYDFLNHVLSGGIDILWRKKAVKILAKSNPKIVLDVACGTGDFALETVKIKPEKIYGVDISSGMLEVGKQKIKKRGLEKLIQFKLGDGEKLDFEDNTFDAITVAFGVRNFENLEAGLADMLRVLKPGGKVVVLEFSTPTKTPMKQLYSFYFKNILPVIGKMFSKDSSAYTYLPESVAAFPDGEKFTTLLDKLGYKNSTCKPLTFGISSIYTAIK